MKFLLPLLLVCLSFSHAEANGDYMCHALEGSDLTKHIDPNPNRNFDLETDIRLQTSFAVSDDQSLIALFQGSNLKGRAVFKLFDSQTGKLIQRQTLENFEERGRRPILRFSPQNRFVYLEAMSYDKKGSHSLGAIPFWNLANNQIVFSPCITAMGLRKVQFSHDLTVAYAETDDSHHSLCSTIEKKALALINGHDSGAGHFSFNPATKHLFAKLAVTNDKNHQKLLKALENNPHVTLYKSPVSEDTFNLKSNDTFAAKLFGPPLKRRLLVAKSRGDRLNLSLWNYTRKQTAPGKAYQHEHVIPELSPDKKPVAFQGLTTSLDGKKAVLLSRSGVIIVLDVATGQLLWKTQLPSRTTKKGYANYSIGYNPLKATHGSPIPPLVIHRSESKAVLLFDWQTGQQRQFAIPNGYLLSYKQYDAYLVFENNNTKDLGKMLLLNWQTGHRQIVERPAEFRATWWSGRLPDSQQLVFKPADLDFKPPHSLFFLDVATTKHRVFTTPYPDARFYDYDDDLFAANGGSSNYVKLTHGYHSIRHEERLIAEGERQYSFELHDMNNRQSQVLQIADLFLYSKLVQTGGKPPEFHTIAYDEEKKQAQFCRLQLQHTH